MADIKPVVMVPDDNARSYADSSAPAREEKDGPAIHATDEMQRLATPWTVAVARAHLLESCEIPEGVILDPACGSATQLAALCSALNKPGLGVELSGAAAPLAAINLERCSIWAGGDWGQSSRILWGDGTVAESILQTYHQNIGAALPIALLHIDPARPQDAQKHTLDEMQPRLDHLLSSWAPFLAKEPALILDLSPRLSDEQRMQIEKIVKSIWGGVKTTWQWMTQGRGRIDRLSLWVGPVASSQQNRLIRLSKTGGICLLEGEQEHSITDLAKIEIGEHLTIADPCLIASGLAESWRGTCSHSDSRWDSIIGRRPTLISTERILTDVDDEQSKHDVIRSFVQISGRIVAFVPELREDLISDIARIAVDENISSLKLRCPLDPEIQPKLQSRVDREMRSLSENNSTGSGFIAEVNNGYVICKEYN